MIARASHMKSLKSILPCIIFALATPAYAQIQNPGFEAGFGAWQETDPSGKDVAIPGEAATGERSVKILSKKGSIQQTVRLTPNTNYTLSALGKGGGVIGIKVGGEIYFDGIVKSKSWDRMNVAFNSGSSAQGYIFASGRGKKGGRFDDFSLTATNAAISPSIKIISRTAGGYGLSPDLKPGQNFDLLGWTLALPVDDNGDGKADTIKERELAAGFEHNEFFYTADDGGLVMKAPIGGATTSKNTKNVRSELREMLRRGDTSIPTRDSSGYPTKNNWVFSTAPEKSQKRAGAIDGRLDATLKVDHVTTTGQKSQIGVVVIGQIHGKDDEPIKVFYRKLPHQSRGIIYASHEPVGEDDIYYDLIGKKSDRKTDPVNGIALGETFSYSIIAKGHMIEAIIYQAGQERAKITIDQTNSGYDVAREFNYFKAGTYNQNNTGNPDDYAQATFYEIKASHE